MVKQTQQWLLSPFHLPVLDHVFLLSPSPQCWHWSDFMLNLFRKLNFSYLASAASVPWTSDPRQTPVRSAREVIRAGQWQPALRSALSVNHSLKLYKFQWHGGSQHPCTSSEKAFLWSCGKLVCKTDPTEIPAFQKLCWSLPQCRSPYGDGPEMLKQSKWGETQRREPKGKYTYLIPVIYTLKLFKIHGLHILILLKNKTNNPWLTHEMHSFLNKCQWFCWDFKLYTLSLLTFRALTQFFFKDQIHEPNLISSCFFPSLWSPLPVLYQFNLFPLKFILRRWLTLNTGKKKVSLSKQRDLHKPARPGW